MSSSFGRILKIQTYGESHGPEIGVVVDGLPAGIKIDVSEIQSQLDRRKPGQSKITTQRKESDTVRIKSGVKDGISLGSPIAMSIPNEDKKPADYDHLSESFRPGHADFTYFKKYGIRDHRGGGRSSARETANWVAAGSLAMQMLKAHDIEIHSYVSRVGKVSMDKNHNEIDLHLIDNNIVRCPDQAVAEKMIAEIEKVRKEGDSLGGIIRCVIKNVPVGLGEPVFDKLQSALAQAMLSLNAVKGFQYGSGFESAEMRGSEHNDIFEQIDGKITTKTNYSGGIQGGISNGAGIYFDLAFKPVSTIMRDQKSVDSSGNEVILKAKGRHDPCVVPRAVPVVDALAALVIADFYLLSRISKI
jgi:chorismate synthase